MSTVAVERRQSKCIVLSCGEREHKGPRAMPVSACHAFAMSIHSSVLWSAGVTLKRRLRYSFSLTMIICSYETAQWHIPAYLIQVRSLYIHILPALLFMALFYEYSSSCPDLVVCHSYLSLTAYCHFAITVQISIWKQIRGAWNKKIKKQQRRSTCLIKVENIGKIGTCLRERRKQWPSRVALIPTGYAHVRFSVFCRHLSDLSMSTVRVNLCLWPRRLWSTVTSAARFPLH